MRWSDRQLAMLREMGIAFSWRERAVDVADDDVVVVSGGRSPSPVSTQVGAIHESGTSPGPAGVSDVGATYAGAAVSLAAAEWLVVGDPLLPSDATAAEQERLLDNMLAAIDVTRSAPTRSGRAAFLGLPEAAAGDEGHAALLDAAVDAVRPACILALGRAAAQAVLDTDEPLGALRGRRETRAGVPVIATFSPAFLLRHPADKAKAWDDLCLAVRSLEESA
jgi:DNA polymerase